MYVKKRELDEKRQEYEDLIRKVKKEEEDQRLQQSDSNGSEDLNEEEDQFQTTGQSEF